jgi:hypothetical protein
LRQKAKKTCPNKKRTTLPEQKATTLPAQKATHLSGQKAKKHTRTFGRCFFGGGSGNLALFRRHFRAASYDFLSISLVQNLCPKKLLVRPIQKN